MAMAQNATAITGKVQAVLASKANFRLLRIESAGKRITVKGFQPLCTLKVGDDVRLTGKWEKHAQYGDQFAANDAAVIVPTGVEGLSRWLSDTGLPGLPLTLSRQLVAAFGDDTVGQIIARAPMARSLLGGHLEAAVEALLPREAETRFGKALSQYDISPALRQRIYAKYGMDSLTAVRSEPYRLVASVSGFPFHTADLIARNQPDYKPGSEAQIVAAVCATLDRFAQDGHTAMDDEAIAQGVAELIGLPAWKVEEAVYNLDSPAVAAVQVRGRSGRALTSMLRAETRIAEAVLDKMEERAPFDIATATAAVEQACLVLKAKLNEQQRKAAITALTSPLSILTGGPGTGKTHTLKVVTLAWRLACDARREGMEKRRIELAAPTGKAAQQMTRSTKMPAQTLHRLLNVNAVTGVFAVNQDDPIKAGLLVADEFTMTDTLLTEATVDAWGTAAVMLTGDVDQIASVGAGRVFGDLIDSGVVPVTRLTEIHRQAKGSAIAVGAAAIREGKQPRTGAIGSSDLVMMESDDPDWIAAKTLELAHQFRDRDVQVLCPGHKSEVGTIALNTALRDRLGLSTGAQARLAGGQLARIGDRVIQNDNDYDRKLFNGDTGIVQNIETDATGKVSKVTIMFGNVPQVYAADGLGGVALSYALSIHKSQGSEFDVVIIPVTTQHFGLLRRTLLYTGVTRAKTLCILVGQRRAIEIALRNDDGAERRTLLCNLLKQMAS